MIKLKQTAVNRGKRMRIGVSLAAVAALGLPLAAAAAPAQAATPTNAQLVQMYVNRERAKAGCRPVTLESHLTLAAQWHASEMARYSYFSHTGRNGSNAGARIVAAGYGPRAWGENIAAGYGTASSVVTAWMRSPGHRANILNCRYTSMGLAGARGGAYGIYWVQTFGSR